uniref:Multiple inositol polyphosphate phosphatase 1 n=1 Tax=Saccoglossus kowalevskii TaxID=10224 RepID=A0ABM0GWL1_SACKO|nr:PREDICTED: multiple inositol polyphosphate phosphatase 1-like [Saccoglossus kowalevskii]
MEIDVVSRTTLLFVFMVVVNLSDSQNYSEFIGDLLTTKTTYEASFGGLEKMSAALNATRTHLQMVAESCVALQVNALIRHGVRYPGKQFYGNISQLIDLQEQIESEEFFHLKAQTNPFLDVTEAQQLAENGRQELRNLGIRYANYFSELFLDGTAQNFTEKCVFISSDLPRTRDSAKAFILGMQSIVGNDKDDELKMMMEDQIEILDIATDFMLRFYYNCEKVVQTVQRNKTALAEYYLFGDGSEINSVVDGVSKRLKIKHSRLTNEHVQMLYTLCSTTLAIFNEISWCEVFTQDELRVMEYWSDVKQYWKKSYGHKINYHISCQFLQHIFSTLEDNHDNSPVGVFRFGHAETLIPLLSILGLYKDEEIILKYDNYHSNWNRTFRASKLSPFAGNIAFVLYSCTDSTGNSTYMIEVLLHEQPVTLPCCASTLCSYDVIKQFYSTWLEDCDLTELCGTWTEIRQPREEL